MELFDRFPREIRDAMNYGWQGHSPASIRNIQYMLRAYGIPFVLAKLKEQNNEDRGRC